VIPWPHSEAQLLSTRNGTNKKQEASYGGTHVLFAAHAEGLNLVERRGVRLLAASPRGRSRGLRRGAEVHHHPPFVAGARHRCRKPDGTGSTVEETSALQKFLAVAWLCCSRGVRRAVSAASRRKTGERERVT
jgi:hypothetical protein